MKTTTTTTRVLDVPAYLLAATGAVFRGRAVSGDRCGAQVQGRIAPVTGLLSPTGVDLGATTIPRGTSMI
jgi:hypothetical protein